MKRVSKVLDSVKGMFSIISRSKYKWWLIMLITLAIAFTCISTFVTKSETAEVFLMGILVSLFINLISSFVTIIFIEERDQNVMQKIEENRQTVVIDKIIKVIQEYNLFFANLLKATSKGPITDIEQRCENIYYETDDFVRHLNRMDFEKEGYMGSYPSSHCFTWDEIFSYETEKYSKAMQEIQDNYLFCLSSIVLIETLKRISEYPHRISDLNPFRTSGCSLNQLMPAVECKLYPNGIEIKLPYLIFRTLDTIAYTRMLMTEIDRINNRKNFLITPNTFTASNVAPIMGSGIDEKYDCLSTT